MVIDFSRVPIITVNALKTKVLTISYDYTPNHQMCLTILYMTVP